MPRFRKYISKAFNCQEISIIIDETPVNLPDKYKRERGEKRTTSVSIKYDPSAQKEKDIVIEGTVIECPPNNENDSFEEPSINIGIPCSTIDWLGDKVLKETLRKEIAYNYDHENQDHVWLEFQTISQFTENKEVHCQVYRNDLKKFETKGTLLETCKQLKSNIVGFGQFSVYLTKGDYLDFYLTGFQLVDVTTASSYSQPEIKISPPDHIVEALNKSHRP